MNKFLVLLQELNLFDKNVLKTQLDSILTNKGVTDQRIINWFHTKYMRWFISPEDDEQKMRSASRHSLGKGDPEWAKDTFDFTRFDGETIDSLNHIIDYFNTLNDLDLSKLDRLKYSDVLTRVKAWDESMKNRKRGKASGDIESEVSKAVKGGAKKLIKGKDFKILSKVGSHFWVKLLTKDALQCEGDDMGHCVGGYDPSRANIVSLWDNKGNSHVTLELTNSTDSSNPVKGVNARQIKGKGNSRPDDKYVPALKDFVIKNDIKVKGDGEALDMLEFDGDYYFEDSPQWKYVFTNKIIPKQQQAFEEIKKRIVTA